MLKNINEVKDAYNRIRHLESKMHRTRTLHALGRLGAKEAKAKLRELENELAAVVKELPSTERHYYYYRRLYGHPVKPAGSLRKKL